MRKSDSVVKQKKASSHLSGLDIVLNQMVTIDRSRTMEELNRAIQGILEYIGEYTKAGRAYTFEFIEKQSIYRNTSEWCAEGVKPQMDNLQAVPFMEMPYWHRQFLRGEKVVIEDIEAAKDEMPLEYRLLKAQDIHTVIVFPMFHTDTLWGFIGLDDPILDESQSLINLLTVVGSHLGSAYDSCHKSNLLDEKQNALQASIDAFQREQRFLQVLCRDYISVFFADLKKDYLEILKVDPEANVLQVSASEEYMTLSYKEIIESYCRQFMMQEEARKLKKRLNAERLMRELKTRDRISFRFQSLPNGAGHEYFEAQITRMAIDEENFKVLIGFRFIDDIVREDRENEAKTDFLSRMAHDIRTPLNAVLGFAYIAKAHIDEKSIVSENLDKLQSAGRYIQRLVDDVTDISQIESGHFHIEPAFFNVMTFFRDFQDIMGQMTADRKLHMTCRAHDILHPQIDADAIRLKQIYVNLVSNAVKYTPEGGMVHFELYEETSDSPGCVRLVSIVQDNGIGMTEDYMKKMYERFSRYVDTRINKVRGSGLGLAIVKELVDRMNGRIEVQSAVGVGTTFRVVFDFPFEEADSDMILQSPMESDLEMAGQSSTESDLTDCEGMHVLIAEDNELNYEVAHEILAMHGITSEQAENGKICVERFMEAPEGTYDAILMDMQMPVMNGLEATKMLRKMDQYHGNTIPIIAMTANVAKTDMDKCLAAGMTGHLAKPLDIHALIAALVSVRKREMQKWRRRIKQW
ncbi:MAG: ATP-binding protein [Coprococcus catus]|nr:ATP-binding protein [Coprococcus catus]